MKTVKLILKIPLFFLIPLCLFGSCSSEKKEQTNEPNPEKTIVIENVPELRKISGSSAETVITRGYHKAGDGGGFCYYKDTVMKNAKDNGGSVIVSEDGTRWRAVYSGALPLRLFGAVGDGKTDDTEAIRSWLSELDGGHAGYASAGSYLFTESIVLPQKDNIAIRRGRLPANLLYLRWGEDRLRSFYRRQ